MSAIERPPGSGIGVAVLGGAAGAVIGAAVFGFLGSLAGSASLANAEPCSEKLCGLGEAIAAVFIFLLIAVPGTYGAMLTGCWLALDRSGYANAGSTVRWLALIVPVTTIASMAVFPESFNILWFDTNVIWFALNALGPPALARWIAVKRSARIRATPDAAAQPSDHA